MWELLDGDFVSGIREFLLPYVGYFLGRRGWGAWVISGIWLRVGSWGGGEQWYEGTILVELGLLRRPIIVTPLRTSNLPSLSLTCRQEYLNFILFSLSLSK